MHGWFCDNPVGVEALVWREAPTPQPKADEVLIRVQAASLNFPDLLTVKNQYQVKPPLPFVPGSEFAGVVDAVGSEVQHLAVGARVASLGFSGGFGTHACAPAARVIAVPDTMPWVEAASFAFTYGTSYHALMDRGHLQAGQTVLVLGAAGGVGSAAVQIAKAAGARVVAAVSSQSKADWCQQVLGADSAIVYGAAATPDAAFREDIKRATDGRGPDVIYDPVGGALVEPAFRSIAWRGRYLVVGFAGNSQVPSLPLNLPLLKGASVDGVFWGDFVRREPRQFGTDLKQLMTWYGQGKIKPQVDKPWPLSQLREAYAAMSERRVLGKVVLVHV